MTKFAKSRGLLATAAIGAGLIIGVSPAAASPIEGAGELSYIPFHDFDGDGVYSEGDRYVLGAAIEIVPNDIEDPDGAGEGGGPIRVAGGLQVFHRLSGFDSDGNPEWSMSPSDGDWGVRNDVAPGEYQITWGLPEGCEPLALPDGFEPFSDPMSSGYGAVNTVTAARGTVNVVAGESFDVSLPVSCAATSIAGLVFEDLDGDGEMGDGETTISGAAVTIDDVIGEVWNPEAPEDDHHITGLPLVLEATSDDAGVYIINNITAGTYGLSVAVPDNCAVSDSFDTDTVHFAYGDQAELDIPVTCTEPIDADDEVDEVDDADEVDEVDEVDEAPIVTVPDAEPSGASDGGVQVDTGEPSGMSTSGVVAGIGGVLIVAGALGASVALRRRNLSL